MLHEPSDGGQRRGPGRGRALDGALASQAFRAVQAPGDSAAPLGHHRRVVLPGAKPVISGLIVALAANSEKPVAEAVLRGAEVPGTTLEVPRSHNFAPDREGTAVDCDLNHEGQCDLPAPVASLTRARLLPAVAAQSCS